MTFPCDDPEPGDDDWDPVKYGYCSGSQGSSSPPFSKNDGIGLLIGALIAGSIFFYYGCVGKYKKVSETGLGGVVQKIETEDRIDVSTERFRGYGNH